MTPSSDELNKFLDELCALPESAIDYTNAPKTTAEDWKDAEVLLPVSHDEFKAIEKFLATLRMKNTTGDGSRTLV